MIPVAVCVIFLSGMNQVPVMTSSDAVLEEMRSRVRTDRRATVVLGYVTSWSEELPDPFSVTHLSYAFATIDDDFKSLTIKNESRFKEIAALKNSNPRLKVLLSIGGWGAGNFSEMASDTTCRSDFIRHVASLVEEYGIDGVDIDWEFPGSSQGKISSSKNDRGNFTKLIRQLRDALGSDRVISFASPSYGIYYDYKALMPYVDFVNIMTYDISVPPRHHAPLDRSELTGRVCVKDVIANHFRNGVPANKMVIGIPFYGRGNQSDYKNFEDYRYIRPIPGTERRFDSVAVAPYIADAQTGELLISYDDTVSIKAKCRLVNEIGARGVMFWHYCGDKDGQLLQSIRSSLK